MIDALTFSSPTPFSNWGVIAMWALFVSALSVKIRQYWRFGPANWRIAHAILAVVIVVTTVVHAVLVQGTMGTKSKTALGVFIAAAMAIVVVDVFRRSHRRR